jgi:excisionase family DNA binding protein
MATPRNEDNQPRKRGRPPKSARQVEMVGSQPPVACSIRDSARLLGIGVTKLYKLVGDGSVKSFCIGTRRLIAYESLLEFCRGQQAR